MSLRKDLRQWIIYDEPSQKAVLQALEAFALGFTGQTLKNHRSQAVRGMGHFMLKLADARLRSMTGLGGTEPTDEEAYAAQSVAKVSAWLAGAVAEVPVAELDELHATVFQMDSRLNAAGINGPGHMRTFARRGEL